MADIRSDNSEVFHYDDPDFRVFIRKNFIPGDFIFDEGMVFTVEPGIYISEEGIGIRIEDDVLVTSDGCRVLTKDMIKEVKDIEEFMKNN